MKSKTLQHSIKGIATELLYAFALLAAGLFISYLFTLTL
jgi:hypothetical protein